MDTSGLYAVLDRRDRFYSQAEAEWRRLIESGTPLLTTNYVLIECAALLQNRLGIDAVRALNDALAPAVRIEWITERGHFLGMEATMLANRRDLSVVDCVSFHVMRQHGITTVFTFDRHFREQGFAVIPENAPK